LYPGSIPGVASKKNLVLVIKKSKLSFLYSSVAQLVEQLTVNLTLFDTSIHFLVVKHNRKENVSKCSYSLMEYRKIVCS